MIVNGDGGIYKVTWEDDSIEVTFERFHEDKAAVRASVWVRDYVLPKPLVHFEFSQNIGSPRSVSSLASELDKTYPKPESYWRLRMKEACIKVMIDYMAGEPVVSLKDTVITSNTNKRIDPFVFMGSPTLIYGLGGTGKSMFAAYLSVLVAEGYITEEIDVVPCNVLYLDWEASQTDLARRVDMIRHGLGFPHRPNIFYRFCARAFKDDFEFIKREVIEKDIGMVIIDSAGPACGGKPSLEEMVIPFFMALRDLKVSSIILGHKPHGIDKPFGSQYWTNYPRSTWDVKSDSAPGLGFSDLGFFNTKVNDGPLSKPLGFKVVFDETEGKKSIHYAKTDLKESASLSENLPLVERIHELLVTRGAMNYNSIAEELSEKPNSVSGELSKNKNRFQRLGSGLWGVTSVLDIESYR